MPTRCWRFISEVPKCTQCELEGSIYKILICFLLNYLQKLLEKQTKGNPSYDCISKNILAPLLVSVQTWVMQTAFISRKKTQTIENRIAIKPFFSPFWIWLPGWVIPVFTIIACVVRLLMDIDSTNNLLQIFFSRIFRLIKLIWNQEFIAILLHINCIKFSQFGFSSMLLCLITIAYDTISSKFSSLFCSKELADEYRLMCS